MACMTCTKPFSLLRKEKGCPGCGFSYCSKCLNNKVFLPKLNAEAKVCGKCKRLADNPEEQKKKVSPPDAYYRRIESATDSQGSQKASSSSDPSDQQILERLQKLKEDRNEKCVTSDEDIRNRFKNIKGETPGTSDAEIQARLAKLRGVSIASVTSKPVLLPPDTRTEDEQATDLMKQYLEQTTIDSKYSDQFDELINDMERRMKNLKGTSTDSKKANPEVSPSIQDSEDEEETVRKIVEKIKAESELEKDEITKDTNDELPFCEICNEDARMRCLGCKYLFCKRCYLEHKDDDDGCNRYEPYEGPNKPQH